MKKSHIVRSILILLSLAFMGCSNDSLAGTYINSKFEVWIVKENSSDISMEKYTSRIYKDEKFSVHISRSSNGDEVTAYLSGPDDNFQCLFYRENGKWFLDEEKLPRNGQVEKRHEFSRYTSPDITKAAAEKLSEVAIFDDDYYWSDDGHLVRIFGNYPSLELYSLKVNSAFIATSIEKGKIVYQNGRLLVQISDRIDDYDGYRKNLHGLYNGLGNEKGFPFEVGNPIYKEVYNYQDMEIRTIANLDLTDQERFEGTKFLVARFSSFIVKEMKLVDRVPRSGQYDYVSLAKKDGDFVHIARGNVRTKRDGTQVEYYLDIRYKTAQ